MFSRNYEPVTQNNPHVLFKAGITTQRLTSINKTPAPNDICISSLFLFGIKRTTSNGGFSPYSQSLQPFFINCDM